MARTLSPGARTVSPRGIIIASSLDHRHHQRLRRQLQLRQGHAEDGESGGIVISTSPIVARLQLHHGDHLAQGGLLLDDLGDDVGRAHLDVHPPALVEEPAVLGVVDPRDDLGGVVLELGEVGDDQVVLVVPGDREHQVRLLYAGILQHPRLAAVLVDDLDSREQSPSSRAHRSCVLVDHGRLVLLGEYLGEEGPDDASSDDYHSSSYRPPLALRS